MEKHLIIGDGNIGRDLFQALHNRGRSVHLVTKRMGFSWPDTGLAFIKQFNPSHVWICAGHGSVMESVSDFQNQVATLFTMPVDIRNVVPLGTKVCIFSTDYVADENDALNRNAFTHNPRSAYASTKLLLEQTLLRQGHPFTAIVRIGSVYGHHYPLKSFPGKVISNSFGSTCMIMPANVVTPTPSWWIARELITHIEQLFQSSTQVFHLMPKGSCSLAEWARLFLHIPVETKERDLTRPSIPGGIGSSFCETQDWITLWEQSVPDFSMAIQRALSSKESPIASSSQQLAPSPPP